MTRDSIALLSLPLSLSFASLVTWEAAIRPWHLLHFSGIFLFTLFLDFFNREDGKEKREGVQKRDDSYDEKRGKKSGQTCQKLS